MSKTTEELSKEAYKAVYGDVGDSASMLHAHPKFIEEFAVRCKNEGAAEERARLLDVAREPVGYFIQHSSFGPWSETGLTNSGQPLYTLPFNAKSMRLLGQRDGLEAAYAEAKKHLNRGNILDAIRTLINKDN